VTRTRCAIVGCGAVAEEYARTLRQFDQLDIVACHDADQAHGQQFAAGFGLRHVCDLDELLSRDHHVTINLTRRPTTSRSPGAPSARAGPSTARSRSRCRSGRLLNCSMRQPRREWWSDARRTRSWARLSARPGAPSTRAMSAGWSRPLHRLQPGPERWHHDPERFHQPGIGPLVDMGPYYLTVLVALLGPVHRVIGARSARVSERTIRSGPRAGQPFTSAVATHTAAILEFAGGQPATFTMSFDAQGTRTPHIEIHGTEASLVMPDPNFFDEQVWLRRRGVDWQGLARERTGPTGRGIGVVDLAAALSTGRRPRTSGSLGLHVVEVIRAIEQSSETGQPMVIRNTCEMLTWRRSAGGSSG
jgi:predicted dehydrogenase